jgi:HlyD family secretion protein
VRVVVSEEEFKRLDGLKLLPGMPAETFIQTEERTAMSYLLKPMTDQLTRAFREK